MAGSVVTSATLGAGTGVGKYQTRLAGDAQLAGTKLQICRVMIRGKRIGQMQINCTYKSNSGSSQDDAMGGDARVQQMLVEMVQIQVGKARMNDFVDERSDYLRSIAEEAKREYNRIASRTMKGLDATGSKVLRQMDQDAYAIERELRTARAEMEAQEKEFNEYQLRSTYSRNEGLFFKSLYRPSNVKSKPTVYKPKYKEEVTTILATPSRDFGTSYRQILYGGLSLVIVSFMWSSGSAFLAGTMMRPAKLAAYGVILSILMTQLAYVKVVTGELEQDVNVPDSKLKEIATDAEAPLKEGVNMSDRQD